jgi:hypothetical protein
MQDIMARAAELDDRAAVLRSSAARLEKTHSEALATLMADAAEIETVLIEEQRALAALRTEVEDARQSDEADEDDPQPQTRSAQPDLAPTLLTAMRAAPPRDPLLDYS